MSRSYERQEIAISRTTLKPVFLRSLRNGRPVAGSGVRVLLVETLTREQSPVPGERAMAHEPTVVASPATSPWTTRPYVTVDELRRPSFVRALGGAVAFPDDGTAVLCDKAATFRIGDLWVRVRASSSALAAAAARAVYAAR